MDIIQSIILGIVEGLTEFLPVSSTGHMIITQHLLGIGSTPFVKAYTVIIQLGAILSVLVLYWRRFFYPDSRQQGHSWWGSIWRFYLKLVVGVFPAVVLGLMFNKMIDKALGSVLVVAVMLVLGGIFMLFCDRIFNKGTESTQLNYKKAFIIGVIQCISMIPGVSRSMATIVGGMSQKLTRRNAAEFSFFLAVPTMLGASVLELYKMTAAGETNILAEGNNLNVLLLGAFVSFVVAIAAIKFFINYVSKYGFKAFGWYRIAVGLILLIALLNGANLQMVD